MNNVHEDAPVVFETRWAMSYLRGPLTRNQIKILMDPVKAQMPKPAAPAASSYAQPAATTSQPTSSAQAAPTTPSSSKIAGQPILPPEVQQYFVPARGGQGNLLYKPAVLGSAQVHFMDTKTGVDTQQDTAVMTDITDDVVPVNWDNARDAGFSIADLEKSARGGAQFSPLPSVAGKARSYDQWGRDLATYLYGNRKYELLKSPTYKQFSKPGESERDFRIRLAQNIREQRDEMKEKLRQKYQVKMASLEEQVRKAQQSVDREAEQQKQQTMQTVISVGSTLLGAFLGGKGGLTSGTVGRATTAAKSAGRIMQQKEDVDRAKETVTAHQQRLAEIEAEFKAETDQLAAKGDPATEQLDSISIRPAKKDIQVRFVGLAWLPYRQAGDGTATPAWQ